MGKQKITMTIDADIFVEFKRLCKDKAMKVSSKVELMMKEYSNEQKAPESPIEQQNKDSGIKKQKQKQQRK